MLTFKAEDGRVQPDSHPGLAERLADRFQEGNQFRLAVAKYTTSSQLASILSASGAAANPIAMRFEEPGMLPEASADASDAM